MQQSVFDENQFYGRDIKSTHAKSQSVEHLTSNQRDAFLFFDALPSYQRANCKLFGIQMPSSGQRKFLCCSYDQYLANFHSIDKKKRHHYEVIRDGFPCRLYFDLEYPVKPNADVDGNNLTRSWLALTAWKIHQFFGITLGTEHFVVLDSCTDKKFSKHVTVNIPCPLEKAVRQGLTGELRTECLFENNIVVGQFVESMLLDIMEEKLGERKVKEPYRKFWVKNEDGGSQFFVDAGVYTRNRQFRVYGSSKHKKNKNLTLDMVDKNMYANFLPVQGKKQKQQREIMIKEIFDKSFVVPTDLFPCLDAKSKSLAAGSSLCKESESVPPLSPSTNTNTNAGEMNWNAQHVSPTPTGRKQKRKRHSPQVHSTSSPSGIAAGSNLKEKCESPILPQDKKVRLPSASPLFSPDEGYGSERSESSVASASSEYSVQDKNQLARIYDPLEFNDQYACLVLPRGARGEGFITTFSSNDNSLSSSTSTKENMQNMQEQRVDSIPVLSFYHSCVGAGTGVLSSSSASNPNRLHASQQSSRSQLASQLSSTQKSQNQGIIVGAPLGTTNLLQRKQWSDRELGASTRYYEDSPFPNLDQYIKAFVTRAGYNGSIKTWSISGGTSKYVDGTVIKIKYHISGYKFCENVGRQHKSNGIWLECDLHPNQNYFFQRCWDPECKGYASRQIRIPEKFTPERCEVEKFEDLFIERCMLKTIEEFKDIFE